MLLSLLFASMSLPQEQSSALFTAGALRQRCESNDPVNASYCYAYIVGVYDSVRAYESWLKMREFCAPANLVQSDLRRAFVDYLKENPAYTAGEAASVVVVSFKVHFPCASSDKQPAMPGPTPPKP